jgi:hypothetical protein
MVRPVFELPETYDNNFPILIASGARQSTQSVIASAAKQSRLLEHGLPRPAASQ